MAILGKSILIRLLKARGIEDYTKLSPTERKTFDDYEKIFAKDISIEDIKTFLAAEIVRLRDILEVENTPENAHVIKARLINYKALQAVILAPDRAKISLEKHIEALIANNKK